MKTGTWDLGGILWLKKVGGRAYGKERFSRGQKRPLRAPCLPMFWHFFHQTDFSVLIFPLKILYCIYIVVLILEAYSEPCQVSKMEFSVKIVNNLKLLTIFAKNSILDIWQGSEYSFGWLGIIVGTFQKN